MLAAGLVLTAPVAWARVSQYPSMAVHLAREGDAFMQKQDVPRALDSYYRVYHYDSNYEPAAYSAGRVVEIMASYAGRKGACLKELDKPSLALIVRYLAGTDSMRKGHYPAPADWDPLAASQKVYQRVFGKAFDQKPLSAGMGERRGDDKKLPALKQVLEKIVEKCHANLPSGPAGHFARELAAVRAEWHEPAMAAVGALVAARASVGDGERLDLILGACSDWQEVRQGQTPEGVQRRLLQASREVGLAGWTHPYGAYAGPWPLRSRLPRPVGQGRHCVPDPGTV
jgi:hypothetical protein